MARANEGRGRMEAPRGGGEAGTMGLCLCFENECGSSYRAKRCDKPLRPCVCSVTEHAGEH